MSASTAFSPYRGLIPYSEEDAPFFFGRDTETEIISANLMASRLTLLFGTSGVGKSSVLRAGAAHHLRQVAHQNLIERGSPEFAVIVFTSWRDDPLFGLVNAIAEEVTDAWEGRPFQVPPPSLDLQQSLADGARAAGGDLIIILDQFEEYFLYHPADDAVGSFAAEFVRAVNRKDLRVSFLISLREDALAKLDRFKGRISNLFDNYLRIEHLDRDAARDAIVKPLEQYNRLSETKTRAMSIEPELVEAVLDQVRAGQVVWSDAEQSASEDSASTAYIETPYLQLVMTRLWDEERRAKSNVLRLATLNRLCGAERIVRTHLDEAMSALPSRDQNVASHIFRFLVTPSGTKIAHTAPDLASYTNMPLKSITPCLDQLSSGKVRILRPVAPPPDRPQVARYEIFHDVLASSILDWRARYEHRMQRRRQGQIVSGLGAVALLIICVLAAYGLNTRLYAIQQETIAAQSQATVVQQETIAQQHAATGMQQDAIAQKQSTAVLQLQVAVQTLAPDVPPAGTPSDTNVKATAIAVATSAASNLICPGPPSIRSFSASPSRLTQGEKSTLSWGFVSYATWVEINLGIGAVATPGHLTVSPITTTTYTLTAVGCGGTTTIKATVVVVPDTTGPSITSVSDSPDPIWRGDTGCGPTSTTIKATVTDPSGVVSVLLIYRKKQGSWASNWLSVTIPASGNVYQRKINANTLSLPYTNLSGTLEYYIRAWDTLNNTRESSTASLTVEPCIIVN